MTTRRGFLSAMLAAAAAPAIVRAESLMPVAPRIWTPPQFEVGTYEGFRFIESPPLTVEDIRRAKRAMLDNRGPGYVVLMHPGWKEYLLTPR